MSINAYIKDRQEQIERFLCGALPPSDNTLHQAMRYVALDGGKHIRPMLVYAAGESLKQTDLSVLDPIAASVELIHCYSLIHDDLPAMDDDDMRRGKPSCHKAFGEAIAILAGDSLQSLAFNVLTTPSLNIDKAMQLHIISHLALASSEMAFGQALDMHPEDIANIESLEEVHLHKTGALIQASVLMGAHAAGIKDQATLSALARFSKKLGLAYQIQDDILDLEAATEVIGKPARSDIKNDKSTFPVLLGTEKAREEAQTTYQNALAELKQIGLEQSLLAQLAEFMMKRHQ